MTHFIETPDGARIAFEEAGEGPTVLLVHGIGFTRAKWEPQVAPLLAAGFRVVRFDLRGFGESTLSGEPADMRHFMADLLQVVETMKTPRFHLVGHSLGGMIAQLYAVEHPSAVATLTLAATTSHNGRRATAFARLMVTFADHGFDAVMADPKLKSDAEAVLGEAFPGGVDLSMLKPGMEKPNRARANAWRACIEYTVKDRLAELRCPVLVTHGTMDRLIPYRAGQAVAESIPGSRFVSEDGAGHSLPKERAESFNRELIAFLRG